MKKRELCRIFKDYLSGRKKEIDAPTNIKLFSLNQWQDLVECSENLKIVPLIYRGIMDSSFLSSSIPLTIKQRLRNDYLQSAGRAIRIFFGAQDVLKTLRDSHIPVIALKGISLAKSLYGDIALRPMTDIDLLIKKEDLIRTGRLLLKTGYKQKVPSWEAVAQDHCHLPSFSKPGMDMPGIELHWNIIRPQISIKVDIDGLWKRAKTIKIDGQETLSLSLEDMLLHLCLHVSYHEALRAGFIPFCDIARLIQRYKEEINWDMFIHRVYQWKAIRSVYLTLFITQRIFEIDLPDSLMDELEPDDFDPAFATQAGNLIFAEQIYNQVYGTRICNLARGSLSTLLKGVFPSRSAIARRYLIRVSSAKVYFYYLVNLYRLFINYGWLLLRLLRREGEIWDSYHQERERDDLCRWMGCSY